MNALQEMAQTAKLEPQDVDHITASWPDLLKRRIQDQAEFDALQAAVIDVSSPADRTWTMMRVAALLTPYYAADVPQSIIAIDAEDWAEALHGYPEWAITKACRWWKGSSNDNRRRKPLEGDIAERCRLEMGIVRVAENALKRGVGISSQEQGHFEPVRERVSPERHAEMMAELPKYMRPKTFGAEGAA